MAHEQAGVGIQDVWRELGSDARQTVLAAFWQDTDSMAQQVEAVHAMAKQYKFRPQSIMKLPVERRARQLASMAKVPDNVIARALVVFHLAERRPMLAAFLDALGIRHEDGVIDETPASPPEPERLSAAVGAISAAFPAADVRLYMRTLAAQDPESWNALLPLAPESAV
jgi:hypothetical protein